MEDFFMNNIEIWATLALFPLLSAATYPQSASHTPHFAPGSVSLLSAQNTSGINSQPGGSGSGSRPSGTNSTKAQPKAPDDFTRVQRPGSVDLATEYDLSGLSVPQKQIHTLLPRDAIPALTDPKTESAKGAQWLPDDARVIEIVVGDDVLGVPLRILDWHEIVNTTIGGEPIAATYCPLCDSATVFSRRVTPKPPADTHGGGSGTKPSAPLAPIVLEFGVSGALYNSNVLMYDKQGKGLWSQLGMRSLSGPLVGTTMDMLPIQVVSFADFKQAHPKAKIVSRDTGHQRDYTRSPYESYFNDKNLMVPVVGIGDALPRKTLGVGIAMGEGDETQSWFVPANEIEGTRSIETPAGPVVLTTSKAGVEVVSTPEGVRTAQTFYYSWSAFYPGVEVIHPDE